MTGVLKANQKYSFLMGSHETPSNLSCICSVLMVLIIIEKSLVFVLKSKTLEMKLQSEEILINLSDNTHINT